MYVDGDKSRSNSILINNGALQHAYGSLGLFHTPPLPGAESRTPHAHTPPSLNDEFFLHARWSTSPLSVPFTAYQGPSNQSFTRHQMAIAMTPQQSASASSSYSESPVSNADYFKSTPLNPIPTTNDNLLSATNVSAPYLHLIPPPMLNDIFDVTSQNYLDHQLHYSNALCKMSSKYLNLSPTKHKSHMNHTSSSFSNALPMLYIINAFIGLAFLSEPWAIAHGGWTAILAFMIVVVISHHCCGIYIKIYTRHTESLTYPSYPQLGWIISGLWAYYVILIFSLCECIGIACVYIIFLWDNMYYLLTRFERFGLIDFGFVARTTSSTLHLWYTFDTSQRNELVVFALCVITILPSILILRISSMHWLCYMSLIGAALMAFVLLVFIILQVISHHELADYALEMDETWTHWISSYSEFSISVGIFLFCLTSNSYSKLPVIQNSMRKPRHFERAVRRAFVVLFGIYVFIGICGYLLFGKSAHSIVLRNIVDDCDAAGIFCDIVCIFFVIATWAAIAPLCVKISDFIESNLIYEWLRNRKKQLQLQQKQNRDIMHAQHEMYDTSIDSIDSVSICHKQTMTTYVTSVDHSRNPSSFGDATVYITSTTKRVCRMSVFVLLLLLSWMSRNHITFLESIVGICFSTVTCMIVPCLLFLKSFWNTLSCCNKLMHILLTVFVIVTTVALLIGSVIDVITK
eukprot:108060_1